MPVKLELDVPGQPKSNRASRRIAGPAYGNPTGIIVVSLFEMIYPD